MIVITGGAGFIGSFLAYQLNLKGHEQIYVVDRLGSAGKWLNLRGVKFAEIISPEKFIEPDTINRFKKADVIFHLGACSRTTETNVDFLYHNNSVYSAKLFDFATYNNIPFYYASSAATYGAGEFGYTDDHLLVPKLRPLNPYGYSKQLFDEWALQQKNAPHRWCGFKFFNVFGPNEYHKTGMYSVVYKAFQEFKANGRVKLFKSHRQGIADGHQSRDFISVEDVAKVLIQCWEMRQQVTNGIYNLGTGQARTFLDLAKAVAHSMEMTFEVEWIEMPAALRDQYQYFTQANMDKLATQLPEYKFLSLEESIHRYVTGYLLTPAPYVDRLMGERHHQ